MFTHTIALVAVTTFTVCNFCSHNSSLEGAMKLKFGPFCSS